jgi:alpha-1,2-glucosyltransferase
MKDGSPDGSPEGSDQAFNFTVHTALNIALFPPLFFFSALYYTEPWSIFWVLLAHPLFRSSKGIVKAKGSLGRFLLVNSFLVAQGIVALLFRQTNIFWIAVFYGGLEAVRSLESIATDSTAFKARDLTIQGIAVRSWKSGYVYDPPVYDACFQGESSARRLKICLI